MRFTATFWLAFAYSSRNTDIHNTIRCLRVNERENVCALRAEMKLQLSVFPDPWRAMLPRSASNGIRLSK